MHKLLLKRGWKGKNVVEWQPKGSMGAADRKDKNKRGCFKALGREKIILDILEFLKR